MKIVANLLQCPRDYTGDGRYMRSIFRELALIAPDTELVQLVSADNASVYQVEAPNVRQVRLPIRITNRARRVAFEQSVIPFLRLRFRGPDVVFWSPSNQPILAWKGPQVVTLFDVRRIRVPEHFDLLERAYFRGMMHVAAYHASRILTVSEHARRDIHDHYRIPLGKIEVAHCAVDPAIKREVDETRINEVLTQRGLRRPYILFVGQQMRVKGPQLLVQAFARLTASRPNLQLALVGKPGNATASIMTLLEENSLRDRLCLIPWVTDDELGCLYSGAEVMVFPSSYEGFGLPVLEAMQCGTPVITTRASSLVEVAGDAAYYLRDVEIGTLVSAISAVVGDEALRRTMIERGLANTTRFSWNHSAQRVLETLSAASNDSASTY